ncbi:integrase, catalytic region, zinc finger, CCHC-type containing protein [Tanacetum coccineum]|uniref:Integrase, catalytic region, zinc finger, CCHC-type containing protein n=1 Tax=Tanacetum coccineum TaxID=301880 RepID=A0ABQ5BUP1_9ASTR
MDDENVLLNIQVKSLVEERENIKLEYQKLFKSIKATHVQHQQEVNELVENVPHKTYAYSNVRAKNQDLLMTISEFKEKLKTAKKGKNVNTKFDKSATLGKLLRVTSINTNKDLKVMLVPKVEVKTDKSKPVTSCSTPKNEQKHKKHANVIARGMYKVTKTETQMPVTNSNMFSSTGVASSSSVRRPESKDTNLKKRVLLNTKFKSTSTKVKKVQSSVSLVSNKRDTLNLNVSESNANVVKAKTINAVHDGLNLICVSCGNDVFMLSRDKCVARYALSLNSRVIQLVLWIVDSGCSKHKTRNLKLLRNFVENFIGIVRCGNDHFAEITGYGDYVQGNLMICDVYYVEGLGHNLLSVGQFCDGDLEVAFRSNTSYDGIWRGRNGTRLQLYNEVVSRIAHRVWRWCPNFLTTPSEPSRDGVKKSVTASEPSNWLERLPAGSISTWEDLTTHFLAQFFPLRRTSKLRNDILMFQQHQGESVSEAWTHFKDLLQVAIDYAAGGRLGEISAEKVWSVIEELAQYEEEWWNDPIF